MAETKSAVDWRRIESWSAALVADDLDDIRDTFERHGARAPTVIWRPRADQVGPKPLPFLRNHFAPTLDAGALPHLDEVTPFALRPALGHLATIEPAECGRDFRYRLYGSILAQVSGFDATGRLMSEFRASAYVAELGIASHHAALQRHEALYVARYVVGAKYADQWHRLMIPLVDDSGRIARFLSASVAQARDGRTLTF